MRVLIALDGSPSSKSVVDQVLGRPWPRGTEFSVISVVDLLGPAELQAFIPDATKAAQATIERAAEQLKTLKFGVSTGVLQGHAAASIVDESKRWNADFVFVGSHGSGAMARFLLGSTALRVVRNAPCSVEIVRAGASDREQEGANGLRILLATDGSESSALAAESVVERPWPTGSEVRVICAPEFVTPGIELHMDAQVWEDLREISIQKALDAVAAGMKILKRSSLRADSVVPKGLNGPKAMVLDEAERWKAALIVVGSHGRHGLDRFLLGSFSESMAMNAPCSVDIIRTPGAGKR